MHFHDLKNLRTAVSAYVSLTLLLCLQHLILRIIDILREISDDKVQNTNEQPLAHM